MTTIEAPRLTDLLMSWQFMAGALALTFGPLLLARRWRSTRPAPGGQERDKAADGRGRRIEDMSTMLVAAVAAYLSANGLRRVGEHLMHLASPADFLPFVGLDLAAMVCGRRARRSARAGNGPGVSGLLFWSLAAVSAFFSASEADSILGAALRAVWPLLAAVLWEIGSLEERRAARAATNDRPLRRLALTRLLSPAESVRVARLLAANQEMSEEEATQTDRVRRAVDAWYDLRAAQALARSAGRLTGWWYARRERRADVRAFKRSTVAGCEDLDALTAVAAGMQLRTQLATWVGMPFKDPVAFARIRDSRIGMTLPADAGHPDVRTGPSQAAERAAADGAAAHPTRAENPSNAVSRQVRGRMGDGATNEAGHTGSTTAPKAPPEDDASDEALQRWLLRNAAWDDQGRLIWGINKIAKALGIGNSRATRLRAEQHIWAPALRASLGISLPEEPAGHDTVVSEPTEPVLTLLLAADSWHDAPVMKELVDAPYVPLPPSGILVPAGHAPTD
ncbi:DUF2637 domain-containing protein [Kitasatospora sp. NPDC056783]|uniref:DUF2637 domain-containing protein n=1 Tax=Kitasatospora sp. NPDC056783 TaxID=3345943 RepID=UPI0036AB813C